MSSAASFVSGILVCGYIVIGLFFLRFWSRSRDRLFGFFATCFFLLAAQRSLLTLLSGDGRIGTALYAVRAFAFLILIYAIWDRNRSAR